MMSEQINELSIIYMDILLADLLALLVKHPTRAVLCVGKNKSLKLWFKPSRYHSISFNKIFINSPSIID